MQAAQTVMPLVANAVSANYCNTPQATVPNAPNSNELIKVGFKSIELNGHNLWRDPENVAIGQLAEAIRLADQHQRSELNINNITPWIKIGREETAQVPIIQDKIQRHLNAACIKLQRAIPECRLDLSQGEFGIRCYMGRFKPSDHIFEEDMVSDSR